MKREKHLETLLSIILGLGVILWITKNKNLVPAIVGIAAIGLFSNYLTEKIHWLWMKISHIMGGIMSKILLSVLFYAFLFPLALLSRIFIKKDSLQLKRTKEASYYSERNHLYVSEDIENPW
jgi:predicted membrane protein